MSPLRHLQDSSQQSKVGKTVTKAVTKAEKTIICRIHFHVDKGLTLVPIALKMIEFS